MADYIARVARGEGFVPWQSHAATSPEESRFRARIEQRKTDLLARRIRVRHPVLMPPEPPLPDFGGSTRRHHVFGLRDARTVRHPPDAWQAAWSDRQQGYRLHVLGSVDLVRAAHGPGQETTDQVGRRVRYLDLERRGQALASTFVALHEPFRPGRSAIVRHACRLDVPASAGPDAVALRLETAWGLVRIFSVFD
jgi:hypothetical protein